MKKSVARLALMTVFLLPLSACVVIADGDSDHDRSDHTKIERHNRDGIAGLSTGMSRVDVTSKMGTPDFDDQLTDGHRVLFYRTQRKHGDGMTTRDECTPLIFSNDKLIGWGQLALDKL